MSEKKFEPCTLTEATHVEMGGKVYLLGGNEVELEYYHDECIGIRWLEEDAFIPEQLFHILGIKTFKEKKREPIEFEATFVKNDGQWHTLAILNDSFAYLNNKRVRFRCVEILEEEK
jgi:hypothetical protein